MTALTAAITAPAPAPLASAGADHGELLTFKVAEQRLALAIGDVAEVIRVPAVTHVPMGPASLLGLINLRGTVLPLVCLAALLDQPPAGLAASSRVVVMANGPAVGLLVDEVCALVPAASERRLDLDGLLARDFAQLARRGGSTHQGGGHRTSAPANAPPVGAAPTAAAETLALVEFTLMGQSFALRLDAVAEVLALPSAITEVPHTDDTMVGVTASRAGLLPLVSLRALLGLPSDNLDPARARVVVTSLGTAPVGLVVDAMRSIRRIGATDIDPVPLVLTRGVGEARIEAIARVDAGGGQRLISILAPARLFDDATAARIIAAVKRREMAPADALGEPEGPGLTSAGATFTAMTSLGAAPAAVGRGATRMSHTEHCPQNRIWSGLIEQFVIFQLGDGHYGVPIAAVDEVVRCPERLTRVPRAPAFVAGVMSLRGRIIPVIDQASRFGSVRAAVSRGRRMVVVAIDAKAGDDEDADPGQTTDRLQAGFVVDAVSEVLAIRADEISGSPPLVSGGAALFDRIATVGRDGRMILLIDPRALLGAAERDILASFAGGPQPEADHSPEGTAGPAGAVAAGALPPALAAATAPA